MRGRRRWVTALAIVVASLLFLISILLGLAVNEASSGDRWPGPLDLLRRYPWWSIGCIAVLGLVGVAITAVTDRDGPDAASKEDLMEAASGLHARLDAAEKYGADTESWITRLPPYAQDLLVGESARDAIRRVVGPFTEFAIDPHALAREWAESTPASLEDLNAVGRLVVAEIFAAHGQKDAAVAEWQAALRLGATPRASWLVRIAHMTWDPTAQSEVFRKSLEEARRIQPEYPLALALSAISEMQWGRAVQLLENFAPATDRERDTACILCAFALTSEQKLNEAITVLIAGTMQTRNPGLLLQLARLLRARAVWGSGDSRLSDAFAAIDAAVRARNLRRSWRTDSAEATAVAAESAIIADDPEQAWALCRPEPDGQATDAEALDGRVLPIAAMGAALTGRLTHARELLRVAPDGWVRRRVEAEIASAFPEESDAGSVEQAWRAVYDAATTEEEKLHALRGLAMEGLAVDAEELAGLSLEHPDAIREIEAVAIFMAISGPDADERIREFEANYPLASIRRAELLRSDDPTRAAQVLVDAMERWNDPRLLLLALDCHVDAAQWEQAEQLAQRALADSGPRWAGRVTVLRRSVDIGIALRHWTDVIAACRALLENDRHDTQARWNLVHAQFRIGDPQGAWGTYSRAPVPMAITIPAQAMLVLELTRRYSNARTVAQVAMAQLRAFAEDRDVQAAAINAVIMRVDRSEIPDEINAEFSAAQEEFFDRNPDSVLPARFAIRLEDDDPLAELAPRMRAQEEAYNELLAVVRNENAPIGLLERVSSKPYAAIFLYRPLGYHRAGLAGSQDIATELAIARSALDGVCIVDASALYTLALLPGIASTLLHLISRPTIVDASLRDLVETDDLFAIPSVGTIQYDASSGKVVPIAVDLAIIERQRAQARTMLTTARKLRRTEHPAVRHLRSLGEEHEPIWNLTLDAAKERNASVYADDVGLRVLAHSLGIKTFGTQSLLILANERERIDDAEHARARRDLIREYVVDLPHEHGVLMEIAAEDEWLPGPAAMALSRRTAWLDRRHGVGLFRAAFHNAQVNHVLGWSKAALAGLLATVDERNKIDTLVEFSALVINFSSMNTQRKSMFVDALRDVVPEIWSQVIQAALQKLWRRLCEIESTETATLFFLDMTGGLDEASRQYAVRLIIEH